MGEQHWKDNRRYAKADVYAVPDLIQDHHLSFGVAWLLRMLCEVCNYRDLVYVGTVAELHELTRLGRRTIVKYIDELCDKELIARLPSPVGSTQPHFDVSVAYSRMIVPNEETPKSRAKKAAKEQQLEPDHALAAPSTRQMTHSTRENTTFGGREAVRREEGEVVSFSSQEFQQEEWSSDPGRLFDQVTEEYGFARGQLEGELRRLGLDPDGDWCEVSLANGLDGEVVKAFMVVVHAFRDF